MTANNLKRVLSSFVKGMRELGIPMIVTQQYTKGLGPTVPSIAEAIGDFTPVEKTSFSCLGEDTFAEAIEASDKGTVILAGIEAHICVERRQLIFSGMATRWLW